MKLIPKDITRSIPLVILTLLMFAFLDISCCKKPVDPIWPSQIPDTLPPITTLGANTGGYMVNGTPVQYKPHAGKRRYLGYVRNSGTLAVLIESYPHFMQFTIDSIFAPGEYELKPADQFNLINHRGTYNNREDNLSIFNQNYTGKIDILRLDIDTVTPKYIISGTFEFCSSNDKYEPTDSICITQGRFDFTKQ